MGLFDFIKGTTKSNSDAISKAFLTPGTTTTKAQSTPQKQIAQPTPPVKAPQPAQPAQPAQSTGQHKNMSAEELKEAFRTATNLRLDNYFANDVNDALAKAKAAYDNQEYIDAYNYYMLASFCSSPEANYRLGLCYKDGKGTKSDMQEALRHFELAAKENHIGALIEAGDIYLHGLTNNQNKQAALQYYSQAARQNSAEGCFKYAKMLERGFATPSNIADALAWTKKAIELGHPFAEAYRFFLARNMGSGEQLQVHTDLLYALAEDFKSDRRMFWAFLYYQIVADNAPHANAAYEAATLIISQHFVPGGTKEAVDYFKKAAQWGHPEANEALADMYEFGNGVPQNYQKALNYLMASPEADTDRIKNKIKNIQQIIDGSIEKLKPSEDTPADTLHSQGIKYEYTLYMPELAMHYYECAAKKGNVSAMSSLGCNYLWGHNAYQDFSKAHYWLTQAFNNGHTNSGTLLAELYGYGHYVEQNLETALNYLRNATQTFRFDIADNLIEFNNIFQRHKEELLQWKEQKKVPYIEMDDLTPAPTLTAPTETLPQEAMTSEETDEPEEEEYSDEVTIPLNEEDGFIFEGPMDIDDAIDDRVHLERAKAGDSGSALLMAGFYAEGQFVDRNIEEALYWLYKVANSSHAPERNIRYACRKLGQWYTIGVNVQVNYSRALFFYEKQATLGSESAPAIIKELKEVIELEKKPEKIMYLSENELAQRSLDAYEEDKIVLALFYARELIRRNNHLGYAYYGQLIWEKAPLGYIDVGHELARACFYQSKEFGNEQASIYIAQTYTPENGFIGNPTQLRRWLELAIEEEKDYDEEDRQAQEIFDSVQEYYEDNEHALELWNSDDPLEKIEIPDWFLLGIESVSEREKVEARILPDSIDSYFDGFIGMSKVKEQLQKIYQAVKLQQRRNEILRERGEEPAPNEKGYNFILLGNPGTGKTSIARIIAKVLFDLNIRENETFIELDRSKLIGEHIGSTENKLRSVLEKVHGGTLFVDEAYTLYKEDSDSDFGQDAINILMKDMEDNRDSYSVIMAGYKQPMLNMIKNANSGFSSRFTYQIEIPDYTEDELIEITHMLIEKQKYQITEGVDDAIRKCIRHDKIDDTFGNARYVRELLNQAMENQAVRLNSGDIASEDDLFLLKPEDFWTGTAEEESIEKYMAELDSMIGLASVKEEVKTLVNRITVMAEMEKRGLGLPGDFGTLHMAFKGNPGTGKTTVARLLGKLYAALGVLKRGDIFVECSRATLVGKYQGHTADNVKKVVQSALGGILFIDEAYSLVQNEGDSFGLEAVDTLVAEIENHRKSLVVIFAGYSREIEKFFENNPGLKSRVPIDIIFEDYRLDELYEIAVQMLNGKNLTLAEEAQAPLKMLLLRSSTEKDFGNARGVRNLVDGFIRKQNVRIAGLLTKGNTDVTNDMLTTITKEDIE